MATQPRKRRQDITSVQVQKSTRAKLDKLGDIHTETYDDIILRLIQFYNDNLDKDKTRYNKKKEEMIEEEITPELKQKIKKIISKDEGLIKLLDKIGNEKLIELIR